MSHLVAKEKIRVCSNLFKTQPGFIKIGPYAESELKYTAYDAY